MWTGCNITVPFGSSQVTVMSACLQNPNLRSGVTENLRDVGSGFSAIGGSKSGGMRRV